MPSAEFIEHMKGRSAHFNYIQETTSSGWERFYGTTASGNLPKYLVIENPCGVDIEAVLAQPGIAGFYDLDKDSFRYHHIMCPFSTESINHYIVDRNVYSPIFAKDFEVTSTVSHTITSGIMIKDIRFSKNGWVCLDNNCPYYSGQYSGTTNSGTVYITISGTQGIRYFYY
jgi:hypothetical protein